MIVSQLPDHSRTRARRFSIYRANSIRGRKVLAKCPEKPRKGNESEEKMCRRRFLPEIEAGLVISTGTRTSEASCWKADTWTWKNSRVCSKTSARTCRFLGLVLLSVLFLVSFAARTSCAEKHGPMVTTKYGMIRGRWSKSVGNVHVARFLGIPYAMPPVGQLRFKPPQPWTQEWLGVRDCSRDGPFCLQHDRIGNIYGQEDCLYLNVYAPLLSDQRYSNTKLPVIVFVHGGGFRTGDGSSKKFPPDYLMDQEVILVTLNYRLSALGFFSTGNKASAGNYGMKDVVEGLKWIQENIRAFGGDPKSVTLFGHSAGAAITHLLALSKKTEGLFDKLITSSGSALNTWAIHPRKVIRRASLEMAKILGCSASSNYSENENVSDLMDTTLTPIEDKITIEKVTRQNVGNFYLNDIRDNVEDDIYDEEIMKCMREVSVFKLMRVFSYYFVWQGNPWCTFGPNLEEESASAIITDHPMNVIKNHGFRDMPWIVGVVQDEGLVKTLEAYSHKEILEEFVNDYENLLPYILEFQEVVSNKTAFAEAIESFYFDGNVSTTSLDNITKMLGDGLITWPTYESLRYQSMISSSSTYFYLFSYDGTFSNTFKTVIPAHYGVCHGDDLNYIFPIYNYLYADLLLHNTEDDITMIHIMTEMWANFARTGVPSALLTPEWPDYRANQKFMRFGKGHSPDITIEGDFLPDRMKFWEKLVPNVSVDPVVLDMMVQAPPLLQEEQETNGAAENHVAELSIALLLCLLAIKN